MWETTIFDEPCRLPECVRWEVSLDERPCDDDGVVASVALRLELGVVGGAEELAVAFDVHLLLRSLVQEGLARLWNNIFVSYRSVLLIVLVLLVDQRVKH